MNDIKGILSDLTGFASITPEDQGCQNYMIQFLQQLGFSWQLLNNGPVSNFFACYGTTGPLLVFAGHTDVVASGDTTKWHTDPFSLTEKNGVLYGRGVADMKGSLASMLIMAKRFVTMYPSFPGRLGFLITSGEEGDLYHLGTPYVMEQLEQQGITIHYCIVGEPSSTRHVGDTIKVGRRGSLHAKIHLQGKQGHVAYPHLAENPIHKFAPVLASLTTRQWDMGNQYFPPTSMQITHLQSGGYGNNIIPGELLLHLNFRYSTEQTIESLKQKLTETFHHRNLYPDIEWNLSGEPFLTRDGLLLEASQHAIKEQTGLNPELSTSGGTSDGRFIAPHGVEVVEIGPVNASIHQVNEWVNLKELEILERIYFSICEKVFNLVKSQK